MSIQSERDGLHYADGNMKYWKGHTLKGNKLSKQRVMIINQGSATECPSRKSGQCQLKNPNNCYAFQAERRYPANLPFKKAQKKQWKRMSAIDFAKKISVIQVGKHRKFTHLRFAESSDFCNSYDVLKLAIIAEGLKRNCSMDTFTYTARRDIMSDRHVKQTLKKLSTLVINGSGFMVHNNYKTVSRTYKPKHKKEVWCRGNCHICKLCKVRGKFTILTVERTAKHKAFVKHLERAGFSLRLPAFRTKIGN